MNQSEHAREPYRSARFAFGVGQNPQLPDDSQLEIAFAGRSNAGKSSALNCLCGQSRLARTGKTPGRTQEINFFDLGPQRYLVDLPGYGYAKVSKAQSRRWQSLLAEYVLEREPLKAIFILMDIRHPLSEHDWTLMELLMERQHPLQRVCVLTKADKISRNAVQGACAQTRKQLRQAGVAAQVLALSSTTRTGLNALSDTLDSICHTHHTQAPSEDDT